MAWVTIPKAETTFAKWYDQMQWVKPDYIFQKYAFSCFHDLKLGLIYFTSLSSLPTNFILKENLSCSYLINPSQRVFLFSPPFVVYHVWPAMSVYLSVSPTICIPCLTSPVFICLSPYSLFEPCAILVTSQIYQSVCLSVSRLWERHAQYAHS